MASTNIELPEILQKLNVDGRYDHIIERAKNGGYHDYKFDRIADHPEYGDSFPKMELVKDLSAFPELADIRQQVIGGKYDEMPDQDDIDNAVETLLQEDCPDYMFEMLGLDVPTKQQREKYTKQ